MARTWVRSRYTFVIGLLAVTAMLAGGVSYAVAQTDPGGTATFYACVSSGGVVRAGTIRVGAAPTSCPNASDAIQSWNAEGPAGAAGPAGAQGPVGQASVVSLAPPVSCPPSRPLAWEDPKGEDTGTTGPTWVLAIASIPGESTADAAHVGEIDLQSWSVGALSSVSEAACGASSGGPKAELHITKSVDKASPLLLSAAMNGTDLGTITLTLVGSVKTLTITFEHAVVSAVALGGGGDQVEETVSFSATKSTLTYS